jgi:hypothetical protein
LCGVAAHARVALKVQVAEHRIGFPAAQQLDFFAVDVSAKKCCHASGPKGSQVDRGKFGARGCRMSNAALAQKIDNDRWSECPEAWTDGT